MMTKRSLLKLIVEKGSRKGEIVECEQESDIRIGRVVKGNNFTIRDRAISQQHLVVEFREGRWVILDLDTSNGTILNDRQIPPQMACALNDGDVIKIGERSALFVRIAEEGGDGDAGVAEDPANIVAEEPSPEVVVRRNPSRRAAAALTRSTRAPESIPVDVSRKRAKIPKNNLVARTVSKKVSIAQNVEAAAECPKEMEKNEILNDRGMQRSRMGEKDEESGEGQPGSSKKNMENITLGQWLDRMEVWLPKQIRDVSEDLIELMRGRAKQVEEFVSHQEAGSKTAS